MGLCGEVIALLAKSHLALEIPKVLVAYSLY